MEPRTRLAWGGSLAAGFLLVLLLATPMDQWATHRVVGFVFKLTLMIGALWLAWPDLVRVGQRLPPRFVVLASVSLFVTLVQPRLGLFLVGLSLGYWAVWRLYKRVFPSGISWKPRRD